MWIVAQWWFGCKCLDCSYRSDGVIFCMIDCHEIFPPVSELIFDTKIFVQLLFNIWKWFNDTWCIVFDYWPCHRVCYWGQDGFYAGVQNWHRLLVGNVWSRGEELGNFAKLGQWKESLFDFNDSHSGVLPAVCNHLLTHCIPCLPDQ